MGRAGELAINGKVRQEKKNLETAWETAERELRQKQRKIGELKRPRPDSVDLVVMLDHSVQVGHDEMLAMLGMNASDIPARAASPKHEALQVLEVKPDSHGKSKTCNGNMNRLPIAMELPGPPFPRVLRNCRKGQNA